MNPLETAKQHLNSVLENAIKKITDTSVNIQLERTRNDCGDYSTTVAMSLAKVLKKPPKDVAEAIVKNIDIDGYFNNCSVTGPGFINFYLSNNFYNDVIQNVIKLGDNYGMSNYADKKRILVEFVSANPTGPMHMGNARGGVMGDCLASLLNFTGNYVEKEFLINDAGNQVYLFGQSLDARYRQHLLGEDSVVFPEDGYMGDDIKTLAADYINEFGSDILNEPDEIRIQKLSEFGLERNILKMKDDLSKYKIQYNTWFSEKQLHENREIFNIVNTLLEKGAAYEKDGAIWLRSTDFGCEKDDVLKRANGIYTYFASDIAYHKNKLMDRNFDIAINIWGADHHGHIKRLTGALDALGLDGSNRLKIILMQLVNLVRDGEIVKMSKRTGKSISLSNLFEEVSVDAARFFFNLKRPDMSLEFDLELATKQDSNNPIYYVQYAHARISSILNMFDFNIADIIDIDIIDMNKDEMSLIKKISEFTEEVIAATRDYDTSKINKYVISLSSDFHKFYNSSRIKDAEDSVKIFRLALCFATQQTIKNCLKLIGVDAPEYM